MHKRPTPLFCWFPRWLCLIGWAFPSLAWGQCYTCLTDDCSTGCTYLITGSVSNPSYTLNSASDKLCIAPGAVVTGNWNVNVNHPDATVVNCGTIRTSSGLNWNQGHLVNYGRIEIAHSLTLNGGELTNHRALTVNVDLNINGSSVRFCNHDSVIVHNNFNAAGEVQNNSVFQIRGHFQQNTGTFCTEFQSLVHAYDFSTQARVEGPAIGNGCALFMIGRTSTVNASGGLNGAIDFCDSTPPPSSPYVDNVSGTIGSNVSYCVCRNVLSLDALSWQAEARDGQVHLTAQARQAVAWRHLRIERSQDGQHYQRQQDLIPPPLAAGDTWQWQAPVPSGTRLWYRLHWQAEDGQWHRARPLTVFQPLSCRRLQGHLNQQAQAPCLHLSLPGLHPFQVEVFDQQGRRQWQQTLTPDTHHPTLTWPQQGLPPGLYLVVVRQQGQARSWRWLAP